MTCESIAGPDIASRYLLTPCSIYKKALDACRKSQTELAKILPPDDVLLLQRTAGSSISSGFNVATVRQFIEDRRSKATKNLATSKMKWLYEAAYSFSSVATHLSELLAPLVPQSPEYTIPLGCLMIVFEVFQHVCFLDDAQADGSRCLFRNMTSEIRPWRFLTSYIRNYHH